MVGSGLGGVGLGITHGAGAGIAGGAVPLLVGGVGQMAKSGADYMTRANARNLMATILRGGTAAPPKAPVDLSGLANALAAYGTSRR